MFPSSFPSTVTPTSVAGSLALALAEILGLAAFSAGIAAFTVALGPLL